MKNLNKELRQSAIEKIFGRFSWFSSVETEDISLNITKNDILDMKETDASINEKVHSDLKQNSDVIDRNVVMIYEKRFRDQYKKLGSLDHKCPYCSKEYKSLNLGEKSCMQCNKVFLVQKRVQDLGTVVFKREQKDQFNLQWKVISDVKKFQFYLPKELEYIHNQLIKLGKKNLNDNEIMQSLLSAYAKNSLSAGHYRLYAAFLYHKAELMRGEQRFAEAMTYYLYIHFLHANGITNSAEFGVNYVMNSELKTRIGELLDLGNFQMKKMKALYEYSILHLCIFDISHLSVNINKSYDLITNEFKDKDERKEGIKPMRSFMLYTKAS